MRKLASPAPVEIQTDSSMLEIRMQGVYSLLQLAIIFTCQLLPNKVVMRPDVRLFGRPSGRRWGRPVAVGSRDRRTASPTAPPTVGRSGRSPIAIRFLRLAKAICLGRSAGAARLCPTTALNIKNCVYKCLKWKNYHFSSYFYPCHRSFQMLFGWKQFISNREPE
jgi:hypothetical protein